MEIGMNDQEVVNYLRQKIQLINQRLADTQRDIVSLTDQLAGAKHTKAKLNHQLQSHKSMLEMLTEKEE